MHIFTLKTLLYLSFHPLGFILGIITILGTPGKLESNNKTIHLLIKMIDFLAILVLKGIPLFILASLLCFYWHYDNMAKILSFMSLGIGLGLFISMIWLYRKQGQIHNKSK